MTTEMDDRKRLGIACGVPAALLLGSLAVSGVPGGTVTNNSPEAVSVASANDSFQENFAKAGDRELTPEEERILYPYRAAKPEVATESTNEIAEPEPTEPEPTEPEPTEPESAVASTGTDTNDDDASGSEADLISPPVESSSVASATEVVEPPVETPDEPSVASAADLVPADPGPADPTPAEAPPIDEDLIARAPDLSSAPDEVAVVTADELAEATVDPAPAAAEPELSADEPPTLAETLALEPEAADPAPPAHIADVSAETASGGDTVPAAPPTSVLASDSPEGSSTSTLSEVAASDLTLEPVAASAPADDEVALASAEESDEDLVPVVVDGASKEKPFLGIGIRDSQGTRITTLYGMSTASQLGLMLGDELVEVNGKDVTDLNAVRAAIGSLSVGEEATVKIKRGDSTYVLGPAKMRGR